MPPMPHLRFPYLSRLPCCAAATAVLLVLPTATAIARPGDIDPSFQVGTAATGAVQAVAVDSQNRLLVGGSFTTFNGTTAGRLLRLLENGAVDPAFTIGTGANANVNAIEILPDGRILLGGDFTAFGTTTTRGLVLLHPNGAVDTTFTSRFSSDGFSVGVTCLESLPDGKIMVGGYFTQYAGVAVGRYAILNTTGALAYSGPQNSGADSHIFDIDLLPDGRILLCGFFTTVNGHRSHCVARLFGNGGIDISFSTGPQISSVAYSVEGQTDGKVIIGGNFSYFFGLGQRYLGRLTATGKLDTTFLGNNGPNLNVYGLKLDSKGRILIAGQFNKFHDVQTPGICRLLPDGSRDPSFAVDQTISASFFQEYLIDPSGRILAYGWSNSFGKPDKINLRRLIGGDWAPRNAWLFQHYGSDSATGDGAWNAAPANDGVTNLEKYALGFQSAPHVPTFTLDEGGLLHGFWADATSSGFRYQTDLARTDASATAEWSTGLEGWTSDGLMVDEENRVGSLVTWKVTLPGSRPAAYFRINVRLNE